MKFGKVVVKHRIPILIIAAILMIPSIFGMASTRINYDMLNYLPEDMDTVIGQNELLDDFGKGAFSFVILEDMSIKDVSALKAKIEKVEHVETVLWYDSMLDISIPMELLPEKVYDAFNSENSTMMAIFFNTSTSSDDTMDTIREIRSIAGEQCFVSGMSALVTDLKDLCEKEEPIYVAIAVILACIAMMVFMDSWLIPFIFLGSIGISILLNMGSNYFLGEISYITKALSAVLQLAVTMDYSIFLWHSYNEQRSRYSDHKEAMATAINETLIAVIGSSMTTVAGFIALCFMSFTLGKDLGIVMAKGVLLGVLGCVTILPSIIILMDGPLQKTKHKPLIPSMDKLAHKVTKVFPVFLIIFAVLIAPAYYGYSKTNKEVYYDMGESLPEDMKYVIANSKLSEDFNIASTHMLLVDSNLPDKSVKAMIKNMEGVEGVKYVLGLKSVLGSRVPEEILPESLTSALKSNQWELYLVNSEYKVASGEVNEQIDKMNKILKEYDKNGMLIGEAPCMKDMIETTDRDFKVVNAVSIIAIFIIIALVEKSFTLPFILVAVIELAIFINLGLPYYFNQSLPFIAPICISTIQLGATVDYAILMTTRYKAERHNGCDKHDAITTALAASIPSIIVSAMGLFAATFGVAVYSDIDIISSMCMLMARGAIISMLCVIFILPSAFMLLDRFICATSMGFKPEK
ncbi:MMPL family transporter [Anaerocolumna aminovalerica]|uniref:efflux RND transporter permease subunit n=1 Tax=Anaerocolumna aminovalerica TaxID=1527 RepID=UPI00248AAC15|nr:MMPL family transporter [Anaerocolumna aminovalerica]